MASFNTISKLSEGVYKEKGSKFIAFAFPISDENEFKKQLENLKLNYKDARHFCYALSLGVDRSIFRQNDDGEPSGTAGKPIYGQILSYDLTNIGIIVIRYFGGTKLGVSGLINAYKTAAKEAIDKAEIITKEEIFEFKIEFAYPETSEVEFLISKNKCVIISQEFDKKCTYNLRGILSQKEVITIQFEQWIMS